MKIGLISDAHLDISKGLEMPGGDVLIIAGDACESKSLINEFHSTKALPYSGGSFPCYDFFKFECAKYKKVFYVMGNHEHYRGKFWHTYSDLAQVMPDHVTILEDQCEEYEGVLFIGSTLWTDMNKFDPITLASIGNYMNDYRSITFQDLQNNTYRKMRPMDTVGMHLRSKQYIEQTVRNNFNKPVVVITHMAPTHMSVNVKYKHENITNGAYCSDLSDLILDNPNIKTWVHGHMHDPCDYMMGDTRVICNPRGYVPWEKDNGFDPNFTFEV